MKIDSLKSVELTIMPEHSEMKDGEIYISRVFSLAIHLCACGCGEETVTPIDDGARGWTLSQGDNGVTLHPSIGNQNMPCKSHYWVQDGKIVWC
jgi:hypothetical protein